LTSIWQRGGLAGVVPGTPKVNAGGTVPVVFDEIEGAVVRNTTTAPLSFRGLRLGSTGAVCETAASGSRLGIESIVTFRERNGVWS
jgi:hypothetical protein